MRIPSVWQLAVGLIVAFTVLAYAIWSRFYFHRFYIDGPIYWDSQYEYVVVLETVGLWWPTPYTASESVMRRRVAVLRVENRDPQGASAELVSIRSLEGDPVSDRNGIRNFALLKKAEGLRAVPLRHGRCPGTAGFGTACAGPTGSIGVENPGYIDWDAPPGDGSRVTIVHAGSSKSACTLNFERIGAALKASAYKGATESAGSIATFLDQFNLRMSRHSSDFYAFPIDMRGDPARVRSVVAPGKVFIVKGCSKIAELGEFDLDPSEEIIAADSQPALTVLTRARSSRPGFDRYVVRSLAFSGAREVVLEPALSIHLDASTATVHEFRIAGATAKQLQIRSANYLTGASSDTFVDLLTLMR